MKTLWILAAAATFAACANRAEDETGAAPDRGDSTMTADTAMAEPSPSTTGYDTTSTTTAPVTEADTSMTQTPSTDYDTTSTTTTPSAGVGTDTTLTPSVESDTTMSDDAGSMQGDSALTDTPDSSTVAP